MFSFSAGIRNCSIVIYVYTVSALNIFTVTKNDIAVAVNSNLVINYSELTRVTLTYDTFTCSALAAVL